MRSVGNFSYSVNDETPNSIVQIWDAEEAVREVVDVIDDREFFTVSVFLESLRLDVWLPSFDKAGFPEVYPEDTVAERNRKLMEVEQKAPKVGLVFYRKNHVNNPWTYLSEIILQNRGRRTQIPVVVPYFTTNQLKILHRDTKLAIRKVSYGDGLIGEGPIVANRQLDRVQLEGDFRIDIDQSDFKKRTRFVRQVQLTFNSVNESSVLPFNENRAYFEVQNNGDRDLMVTFGSTSSFSPYFIKPHETYYPQNFVPIQRLLGKTQSGETTATVMEWEYF